MDDEILAVRVRSVERKQKDIVEDLDNGYVYFVVDADVNGRPIQMTKKVRLDKPEKMLNKFMSKILKLSEEQYKEVKYFVADKQPPESLVAEFVNRSAVEDAVLAMLEEVEQYLKTGKFEVLATGKASF